MPVPDSISVVTVQNSQIAKVFPVFTVSQNVVITKLIPSNSLVSAKRSSRKC